MGHSRYRPMGIPVGQTVGQFYRIRKNMKVTRKSFEFHPTAAEIKERRKIAHQLAAEEGYDESLLQSLIGESFNFFEMGDNHSSLCFLCGEKLVVPCVAWFGCDDSGNGELWLHTDCARQFAEKLLAEYHRT
jgi:hypothetical protein